MEKRAFQADGKEMLQTKAEMADMKDKIALMKSRITALRRQEDKSKTRTN